MRRARVRLSMRVMPNVMPRVVSKRVTNPRRIKEPQEKSGLEGVILAVLAVWRERASVYQGE